MIRQICIWYQEICDVCFFDMPKESVGLVAYDSYLFATGKRFV